MNAKITSQETQSFGRYLQAHRLDKGISLATVARDTRIRKDILQRIEEEDHAQLPDEVFVKGFLRAYAEAIGANADEAIERYQRRLQVINKLAQSEADLQKVGQTYWRRLLIAFVAILGIMVISLYTYTYFQSQPHTKATHAPEPQQTSQQPAKIDEPSLTPAAISKNTSANPVIQKYILKIKAVEETWMKVTIDDREPNEYSLNSGDYLELEASTSYELLIGNNGGVALTLNDQTVAVPGKRGEVASITLP